MGVNTPNVVTVAKTFLQRFLPCCSPSESNEMVNHMEFSRRIIVAKKNTTSPKILTILASDNNIFVRETVAKNPSTPPEALNFLVNTCEPPMWLILASNPSTPPEALEYITKTCVKEYKHFGGHEKGYLTQIMEAITQNPSTPTKTLQYVTETNTFFTQTPEVLLNVVSNPQIDCTTFLEIINNNHKIFQLTQNSRTYSQHLLQQAQKDGICSAGQQIPTEWLTSLYVKKQK